MSLTADANCKQLASKASLRCGTQGRGSHCATRSYFIDCRGHSTGCKRDYKVHDNDRQYNNKVETVHRTKANTPSASHNKRVRVRFIPA